MTDRKSIADSGLDVDLSPGAPFSLSSRIVRLTAPNPGPFTFHGTNSYILGKERLAVIDPGPDMDAHFDALVSAIAGRPVSHIFVTHTHRDHSPLARRLAEQTGAICIGEGPHRYTNGHIAGDGNALDASADLEFMPDLCLGHNEVIDCGEFHIRGIATPGHAQNHMAFSLEGADVLFSGDHVMGWATTIVAPPDGSMESYLASLALLSKRKDRIFLPGHGEPVQNPQRHSRALRAHRLAREQAILDRIKAGDTDLGTIVSNVYHATDKRLHGAAALTALAHLERLAENKKILIEGVFGTAAKFLPT